MRNMISENKMMGGLLASPHLTVRPCRELLFSPCKMRTVVGLACIRGLRAFLTAALQWWPRPPPSMYVQSLLFLLKITIRAGSDQELA